MNPIEIIRRRRSSRTYLKENIRNDVKINILEYINLNNIGLNNEKIDFSLIERSSNTKKPMKLDYGLIKNHNTYILGKTEKTGAARVNYGYLLEKIVLKATEMNLGTCWVGYFDELYFSELKIEEHEEIPGIIILGYPREKTSYGEKFVQYTLKSLKRKEWEELFFMNDLQTPLTKIEAGKYYDSLEMVRFAPSSGNTQPWRIIKESGKNIFHFYKKPVSKRFEKKGLHEIDLGISLAHFEITSQFKDIEGEWKKLHDQEFKVNGLEYILSWEENN